MMMMIHFKDDVLPIIKNEFMKSTCHYYNDHHHMDMINKLLLSSTIIDHHVIKMTKYSLSLLADIDQPNMNHNHNYYRP